MSTDTPVDHARDDPFDIPWIILVRRKATARLLHFFAKEAREGQGYNLKQIAEITGMTHTTVSKHLSSNDMLIELGVIEDLDTRYTTYRARTDSEILQAIRGLDEAVWDSMPNSLE